MYRKIFYVLIVGVFVFAMTAVSALASGLALVVNDGETMSGNMVHSGSNSGTNVAEGSYGGDGGDGGNIRSRGDVNQSSTGSGGLGGASGVGGTVTTGSAQAETNFNNEVASSITRIDRCACPDDFNECNECDDVNYDVVYNRTRTMQLAEVGANANTGANIAQGSEGGEGGEGGNISTNNDGRVDESMTGDGADGGLSGPGGLVNSGESSSRTTFVNVVGRNITRIFR